MGQETLRSDPAVVSLLVAKPWDADEDSILVCRAVRDETHDVRTFVFGARTLRRFAYMPGQFMTFAFEIDGETVHRCYTLASAPTRPNTVSITVKRVANGPVSNWLHDHLNPGDAVRAIGPMGDFSCFRHPAEKHLYLSGGSGITPSMSMARTFFDLGGGRDIAFLHSARAPRDLIFAAELETMTRQDGAFRFAAICEQGQRGNDPTGRLDLEKLHGVVPDFLERECFVCGPAPYMAAVREMLRAAGFDMARHHEESFDFDSLLAPEQAADDVLEAEAAPPLKTYRVEFARTRRVLEVPEDTTVLEAARKAGLRLPSSCTKGVCGTCKSKLVSGTVAMTPAGGIRQREIDAGLALLCCSKPTSNLVVER